MIYISQAVSYTLVDVTNWINIVGVIYEFSVILFFIVNFCKHKSRFRQPYFLIYVIGCIVDIIPKILGILSTYSSIYIIFAYPKYGFDWYNKNFVTFWNLLLAFNRFTAILFSVRYSKIWSKRNTALICIFLVVYPFLIHSFNYKNMWCRLTYLTCLKAKTVTVYTKFEEIYGYASDVSFVLFATLFGSFAAVYLLIKNKMSTKNSEKVLLIQSLTSSIFLICFIASEFVTTYFYIPEGSITKTPETKNLLSLQLFFSILSNLFYDTHHYTGLILLFIMS